MVFAALAGLVLVGAECIAYGEHSPVVGTSRGDLRRTAQVWLSICAAIYGATLLVAGFAHALA